MIKCKWIALIAPVLFALAAVPGAPAAAQSFPNKPIRLVLPYAPGGATDFTGRTVAQHMSEVIGQQVVAENRTGSGGIPGTDYVVRSAPDGYTLVLMDPAIVINPSLLASMPFDLFKDLKIVSRVNSAALVLVASPHLPVKTFAELVAHAKANPGKLNFSSAGIGTTPHLAGELFKQRAGFDAVHVPYRGIGQSYTDMMSGKIQFAFSSFAGALPFTGDNRVRALATTGLKRSTTHYADLPTVDEAGLKGFEVELWYVILAPAGDAAGRDGEAQRRAGQDAGEAGAQGRLRQDRRRAGVDDAGGGRRLPQGRVRQVEEGDRRRQYQGELRSRFVIPSAQRAALDAGTSTSP